MQGKLIAGQRRLRSEYRADGEGPVCSALLRRPQTHRTPALVRHVPKHWYGLPIVRVVEREHTTKHGGRGKQPAPRRTEVAFVRRKGNAYYLVHNVRSRGKVKQLHLARLGARPCITDELIRDVSRQHPFLDLDWKRLQEQVASTLDLYRPDSAAVTRLLQMVGALNVDLGDLSPTLLQMAQTPATTQELVNQLRLLRGTLEAKLHQFERHAEPAYAAGRR